MQQTLLPKMSGNLNNCAFNCALPTILEKIKWLQEAEESSNLPSDDDPVYINYKKIKTYFAQSYGLSETETEQFSWAQFQSYLLIHDTFSAQEILFAPVFRLFIAETGPKVDIPYMTEAFGDNYDRLNTEWATLEGGIDEATGKYLQLDFPVMEKGFYQLLGIKVNLSLFNKIDETGKELYAPSQAYHSVDENYFVPDSPLSRQAPLDLFLKEGHFEIQPHNEVNIELYHNESSQMQAPLKAVFTTASEETSAKRTSHALANLFTYVSHELKSNLSLEKLTLEEYAKHGRKFHEEGKQGTLTFVLILLMLAQEQYPENAQLTASHITKLDELIDRNMDEAVQWADTFATALVNNFAVLSEAHESDIQEPSLNTINSNNEESNTDDQSIVPEVPPSITEPVLSSNTIKDDNDTSNTSAQDTKTLEQTAISANFKLNCMIGVVIAGAAILCLLFIANTAPVLAAGLCVAGAATLLASAGLFAYQKCTEDTIPSAELDDGDNKPTAP